MPESATPIITLTRTPQPTEAAMLDVLLSGSERGGGLKGMLSLDFDAHDIRLRECLESAIDELEAYTGRLILPAMVQVRYASVYDWESLPWGPVTGNVTATDLDLSALTLTGVTGEFPVLTGDYPNGIILSYSAGYTLDTLPGKLREAIYRHAANAFDNGERNWTSLAATLRTRSWAN